MKKQTIIRFGICLFLIFSLGISVATAQEAEEEDGGFGFGLGMDLGVQTFLDEAGEPETFQRVGFIPDISFGKFGLSLDLSFHVASDPDNADMPFKFRKADWVPEGDTTFLELYLPKFNYIRYGEKGEPLFVKLGSIDDGTLGTGFIMGNYSNKLFMPNEKIFGMSFDMDGNLFNFPYVGFESFIGNLAHPDVIGGRLFGRPLIWSDFPIVKDLEIGFTLAGDIDPAYREEYFTSLPGIYTTTGTGDDLTLDETIEPVMIWGIDAIQPILSNDLVSLAAFASMAVEPVDGATSSGVMIGAGGRFISFLPYMFQIRYLGENFIPSYFDTTYDLYRAQKYAVLSGEITTDAFVGWLASTGFSLLEDKIAFNASIDGPFASIPDGEVLENSPSQYPHMRLAFTVAEGLLPGIYFDAYYDKQYIASLSDIFDPVGALIGANVNYKTGPAIITLAYDVKYDPSTGDYSTTAKLMTSIGLF